MKKYKIKLQFRHRSISFIGGVFGFF